MDGRRTALIIASDDYEHPGLSRLRAPAADAQALANVLGDKEIGDFRVQIVHNAPAHIVQGHIEDLFAESQSDDLVLLHFSGHGLKSDAGELFFATRNTRPERLASTAVPADFVQRCMRTSRARSIVLLLDCCYGGAFDQGVTVRAAGSANVLENFPAGRLGGGRGRAVITASSAMEYAFEGDSLADEHQQQPSVFTAALVEGLSTGEADHDEDGLVSLNELYDYVFDRVRERNPKQTPGRDVELQGELYLARSRRRRLRPLPIPGEVAGALKDDNMFTRLGAVAELRARMTSTDLGAALGAYEALVEVARSDIKYVQDAASEALASAVPAPLPAELHFGTVPQGDLPVAETLRMTGPPLAGAVKVSQSEAWIIATTEPTGVHVSIDTSQTGPHSGTVTLTGPTGQVVVPVTASIVGAPAPSGEPVTATPASLAPPLPSSSVAAPAVAQVGTSDTSARPATGASGVAGVTATEPEPEAAEPEAIEPEAVEPEAARARPAAEGPAPAQGVPAPPTRRAAPAWKLSGIAAVIAGGLMLLSILLPQQYGEATYSKDPYKAAYLLFLGLVVVLAGVLVLSSGRRIQGLGAVLGAAPVGSVVALDMVNTADYLEFTDLGLGLVVGLVAPLVLVAAGIFAVSGARRETDPGFAAPRSSDRALWVVLVLAVAGAMVLVKAALDTYSSYPGWALQGLWLALLALAVPLTAVLTRPVPLSRWMLVGWALAGAAPVLGIWGGWENSEGSSHGMWFVMLTLAAMAGLAPLVHRGRA